ncbi:MAG: efflux RND transporter periplasmic adaptor subunit [Candidatus Taylorbacteria bacterium]
MKEINRDESMFKQLTKNIWVTSMLLAVIIIGSVSAVVYWKISGESITTDNAIISAPITKLTTNVPGILNQVFVNIGDEVPAYTIVAQVGNELLKTKTASEVVSTLTAMGTTITPGTPVVSVINPDDLRVIAHIDEDKGLSAIHVGQQADFTVDAYGSQKFHGVVDEISPTARQGDIVFNISDKRQINQFDIKIRFDTAIYSELKNGMSAKVWIYK